MPNNISLADFFTTHGRLNRYSKGQILYSPGDTRDNVMLITKGLVKIYDIDSFTNERTVSIFGPNHLLPLVWLLKHEKDVLFFYEAMTDTETYVVDYHKVIEFIRTQPDLLMGLLDTLTKAYINQDARIFNLQRANIREKLEFALFYLAHRLGTIANNIAVIPVVITRSEIANLAGSSRESISRELNNITAAGLMWKKDGKTYIDLSKMKQDFHKVYR
ncbi:MAG TPA: Crp/Fnr family transcriptional regulator [Candidatus Saccharimonadales bacterium]|nr:Crp/Fnr family transcriptional regulator [Candidatus Saccharimonadales bacterium]